MTIREAIDFVDAEPELPGNPIGMLGFCTGLKMTAWMIFHPWASARLSTRGCKKAIIQRLADFEAVFGNQNDARRGE